MEKEFVRWFKEVHPDDYKRFFKQFNNRGNKSIEKIPFDDWWQIYGKKVGRFNAEKKWNKLSLRDQKRAMLHTPEYVKNTPDKQYRLNPQTYLNQKRYNDEEIIKAGNNKTEQRVNENLQQWRELFNQS